MKRFIGKLTQLLAEFISVRAEKNKWQRLYREAETQIAKWQSVYREAALQIETYQREKLSYGEFNPEALHHYKNLANLQARTINEIFTGYLPAKHLQDQPLVSIIMPVWNRAEMLAEAVRSVLAQTYQHWQLIIVDDGSTDNTAQICKEFLSDPRIEYHFQENAGVSTARNQGYSLSKGEFIAYLDSDNLWYPYTLSVVVSALVNDSACDGIYFAELWHDYANNNKEHVYFPEQLHYDDVIIHESSKDVRGIDINSFVHRRKLFEQVGGFDVSLTRLTDYEFTYRCWKQANIKSLPLLGTFYRYQYASNNATAKENFAYNFYQVRARHQQKIQRDPLRVLYLLDHYPQVTESYVYSEIEYMQRMGVHIEIWSEHKPVTPFATDIPIYRGTLAEAVAAARPDLVHGHWLAAYRFAHEIEMLGLSMTVRAHGFDFYPEHLQMLNESKSVYAIYAFPHFYQKYSGQVRKMKAMTSCFNPQRYFPGKNKNRKMVLRVAAGLPTKDLHLFFRIAQKCPEHQFVMVIARCRHADRPRFVDELIEYNLSLGNPVDLRINLMPEDVAPLMREAGIYLHTHSLPGEECWTPLGMSISISEAMATGAYVLGRRADEIQAYIGNAGDCYANEDEAAAFVNATLNWTDEEWHARKQRSLERAFTYFVDDRVLPAIYYDWLTMKFLAQRAGKSESLVSAA